MREMPLPTRDRILNEAARLFATRGYNAVSVRDLADAVEIKPASLYHHFNSKEEILEWVLSLFEERYQWYFANLGKAIEREQELHSILDILFASLRSIDREFMYYGMCIVMREQINNTMARDMACRLFYTDSINYLTTYFDDMVRRGIIVECDTGAIATFFMFSVLVGTEMRVLESTNENFPVDINSIYDNLYNFILKSMRPRRLDPAPAH